MNKLYTLLTILLVSAQSFAQTAGSCDGSRYILDQFPTVTKTTIQYATNKNVQGLNQKLYMDIYTPDGDIAEDRPVIIWAFGGSFIVGQRSDMASYCIAYAKKGYVTATIDYRLWPLFVLGFPTGDQVLNVVVQAVSDMKGAVRYFKKDADLNNAYRINPSKIIIGGVSAGAIAALHAANLESTDTLNSFIQTAVDKNGGIDGNTGDSLMLTYSPNVAAVVNLSGGLYNANWIDEKSSPIMSYHGNADATVPYTSGIANGLLYIEGSKLLNDRCMEVGIENYLVTVPGGGHTDIYSDPKFSSYLTEFSVNSTLKLEDIVCENSSSTSNESISSIILAVPNPSSFSTNFNMPEAANWSVTVYTLQGLLVSTMESENNSMITLEKGNLASGLYVVSISNTKTGKRFVSKVSFN